MRTLPFPRFRSLFLTVVLTAMPGPLRAEPSHAAKPPPLGLSRLKNAPHANDATPLAAEKFSVDGLLSAGAAGVTRTRQNDVDLLALDPGAEWSRPLRGNGRDVSFVSFQLHASPATIIDLAGVRLGFTASPAAGSLQVMFDDSATGALQWKALHCHVAIREYGGRNLAALPTLTVRLDPGAGTWDLFSGNRLIADNLPLIAARKGDRRFVVRSGAGGAWLTGLVFSDENPLYDDANANGIDDRFEIAQRRALLPPAAAKLERQVLVQLWKDSQRVKPPPAFFVQRPLPDSLPAGRPKS